MRASGSARAPMGFPQAGLGAAKVRKFVKTARIAPVTSASERTLTSLLVTLL